ncbi:helix-turn-helix domain-containing protein [Haloarchaeobius sp. DT45]|uniref:helix-turn-helix domain-containing protein n=1 Tax=Haloarchaeobius sp. DT45 TaxID=3446116 RepID=UPI003F6A981A
MFAIRSTATGRDDPTMTDQQTHRGDDVTESVVRPDLDTLAAVLDADCRRLLTRLGTSPQTATELADACDLPKSTTYRKLDQLRQAGVLEESVRLQTAGKPASQYELTPAEFRVRVTTDGSVVVDDGSD